MNMENLKVIQMILVIKIALVRPRHHILHIWLLQIAEIILECSSNKKVIAKPSLDQSSQPSYL